jgi:hypothetical protein
MHIQKTLLGSDVATVIGWNTTAIDYNTKNDETRTSKNLDQAKDVFD